VAVEHVDRPHRLFDECTRVAHRLVIIALANKWVGLFWSLLRGHNVSHSAGYGFPASPRDPGDHHKWFFNLEEAERFVRARAARLGHSVVEMAHVFERGQAGLVHAGPYPRIPGVSAAAVRRKRRNMLLPFLIAKYAFARTLSWLEELV